MRKSLWLAPPLATLLFMVGCNTCNTGTCDATPACGPAAPACAPAAAVPAAPVVVANADAGVVVDVGAKPDGVAVAAAPQLVGVGVNTAGDDSGSIQVASVTPAPNPAGGDIMSEAEYARLLAEGKVTAIPGYTPSEEVAVTKTEAKKTSAASAAVVEMAAKAKVEPASAGAILERRPVAEAPVLPTAGKGTTDDDSLSTKEVAITADQLVSPSLVITPAQVNNAAVTASLPAPKAPLAAPAVAKLPAAPASSAKVVSSGSTVPTIPGMPLPEGWDYIHELDLTGGRLNTVAIDQLYSGIPSRVERDI